MHLVLSYKRKAVHIYETDTFLVLCLSMTLDLVGMESPWFYLMTKQVILAFILPILVSKNIVCLLRL